MLFGFRTKMSGFCWRVTVLSLLTFGLHAKALTYRNGDYSGITPYFNFPRSHKPAFASSGDESSGRSYTSSETLKPAAAPSVGRSSGQVDGYSPEGSVSSYRPGPPIIQKPRHNPQQPPQTNPNANGVLQTKAGMWNFPFFQNGNSFESGIVSSSGIEMLSHPQLKLDSPWLAKPQPPAYPAKPQQPQQPQPPAYLAKPQQPSYSSTLQLPAYPAKPQQPQQPQPPAYPAKPQQPTHSSTLQLPAYVAKQQQQQPPAYSGKPQPPTYPAKPQRPQPPTYPAKLQRPQPPTYPTKPQQPQPPAYPAKPQQPTHSSTLQLPAYVAQQQPPAYSGKPQPPTYPAKPQRPQPPTYPAKPQRPQQPQPPAYPAKPQQPTHSSTLQLPAYVAQQQPPAYSGKPQPPTYPAKPQQPPAYVAKPQQPSYSSTLQQPAYPAKPQPAYPAKPQPAYPAKAQKWVLQSKAGMWDFPFLGGAASGSHVQPTDSNPQMNVDPRSSRPIPISSPYHPRWQQPLVPVHDRRY
ncbi:adhesive plaque matrix protein-like [Epinephelus moara]|uniref:adhesive plaque matrix protein-like n=1 Tax=Epinephelus moara TaxID=300413 RepID=UPI00214EB642|nr:adhesive plaque matrix protein-like [Epinephelus moara]